MSANCSLDAIPGIEQKRASRAQDAASVGIRDCLVRKEHHTELTHDHVEARIGEGQFHRVGLTPFDRARNADPRRLVKHRLIEVGRDN